MRHCKLEQGSEINESGDKRRLKEGANINLLFVTFFELCWDGGLSSISLVRVFCRTFIAGREALQCGVVVTWLLVPGWSVAATWDEPFFVWMFSLAMEQQLDVDGDVQLMRRNHTPYQSRSTMEIETPLGMALSWETLSSREASPLCGPAGGHGIHTTTLTKPPT